MSADPRARAALALILAVAALLRVGAAVRPGLWVDEVFSLAIATGHSLEHPPDAADPAQGDFVEPTAPQPAAAWQRYLAHEDPPAGLARVVRAVRLSDTSPPLYYVLLAEWTRWAGTSDAALRLFSTACALLALPLLWSIGGTLGGVRVAALAGALYALAPAAIYYAAEGRMYALTWLCGLALARLTLAVAGPARRPGSLAAWVAVAAAGLLTHYFFAFVVAALLAWLVSATPPRRWWRLAVLAGGTGVVVAPWYAQVPATLAAWRVTGNWLEQPLGAWQLATGWLRLAGSLVNTQGVWGGGPTVLMWGQGVLYVLLGVVLVRRGVGRVVAGERALVWLWLLAAVVGPLVFDVWRGTATSRIERYALPGLPAAVLGLALAITAAPRAIGVAALAGTLLAWAPAIRHLERRPARPWAAYPDVAERLAGWTAPTDVVIVDSIPSGVLGVARYLDPATSVASWVLALGRRRMPADAEAVVDGRCRIALVTTHLMTVPAPVHGWLRSHAALVSEERLHRDRVREQTEILLFDRCASRGPDRRRPASSARGTP